MNGFEIVLLALMLIVLLAALADRLHVPYPILFLLGGAAIGFAPGLPHLTFDPEVLLLVFIPPLAFSAGWRSSWREFRAHLWPITLLSTGLVFATMVVVAVVAHLTIAGLSWSAAFVFGTVLASTDSVAPLAIIERLRLARNLRTILSGESLGNDAASLTAYRTAVAAAVSGSFVLATAAFHFALAILGGIVIGVIIALVYDWIQHRIQNTPAEVILTLVVPYAAYIPADRLGVSGLLAVLTAALLASRRVVTDRESGSRIAASAFWDSLILVMNGLIFILLGFYLPDILAGIIGRPIAQLVEDAALMFLVILLVRAVWVFAIPYIPAPASRRLRERQPNPIWKPATVITWAGMRGADTLVLALAIPLTLATGASFPDRSLIIFLSFCVIAATLLIQGLTLPALLRWLNLRRDDSVEREEATAREAADRAALQRLDDLEARRHAGGEDHRRDGATAETSELAEHLRDTFERQERRHAARSHGERDEKDERAADEARRLRNELVQAQRQAIIALRDQGKIDDDVLREVLRDLDLEEQRLQ